MKTIIIDTNKILAATLKPGKIRTLIYQAPLNLITPHHTLEEAQKHSKILANKAKIDEETFILLLEKIINDRIHTKTPHEHYITRAKQIAETFDPDDWPFIALALEYGAPIWTNDKELIQNSIKTKDYRALDTQAIEMLLEWRSQSEIEEYLRKRYG